MSNLSLSSKRLYSLLTVALVLILALIATVPASAQSTVEDCAAMGPTFEAYRIRYGDTLSHVARLYGVSHSDLAGWNGITNRNLIYLGTYLCVDLSVSSVSPNTVTGTGASCATSGQPIKWGDTLSGVAYAFGTTVRGISNSGRIANPDWIFAGETILIPPAGTPIC